MITTVSARARVRQVVFVTLGVALVLVGLVVLVTYVRNLDLVKIVSILIPVGVGAALIRTSKARP